MKRVSIFWQTYSDPIFVVSHNCEARGIQQDKLSTKSGGASPISMEAKNNVSTTKAIFPEGKIHIRGTQQQTDEFWEAVGCLLTHLFLCGLQQLPNPYMEKEMLWTQFLGAPFLLRWVPKDLKANKPKAIASSTKTIYNFPPPYQADKFTAKPHKN